MQGVAAKNDASYNLSRARASVTGQTTIAAPTATTSLPNGRIVTALFAGARFLSAFLIFVLELSPFVAFLSAPHVYAIVCIVAVASSWRARRSGAVSAVWACGVAGAAGLLLGLLVATHVAPSVGDGTWLASSSGGAGVVAGWVFWRAGRWGQVNVGAGADVGAPHRIHSSGAAASQLNSRVRWQHASCAHKDPPLAVAAFILGGQGVIPWHSNGPGRARSGIAMIQNVGRRRGTFVDVIELVCDEPWGKGS